MTLQQIQAMSDGDLDRLAGELFFPDEAKLGRIWNGGVLWNPCDWLNHAAAIRKEIERRGLQKEFIDILCRITGPHISADIDLLIWKVVNASSRQQTEASMMAVGGT